MAAEEKRRFYLEKELLASREILEGIIETATDAIVAIDAQHRIVLFNWAAEEVFGYRAEEVLGQDLDLLLPPRLQGKHFYYVQDFLKTGSSEVLGKVMEGSARRKSGEIFPVRISRSATRHGDTWIFTAILRDVSKQKEMEKRLLESEKLAAVGMAVSRIVHEIKNPLVAIGGFVQALYRKETAPDKKKKLELILHEVKRLEKLLSDIGQFGKPLELDLKRVDLVPLCREALEVYRPRLEENGIRVVFKAPQESIPVEIDEMRFKEVLFNIMHNALEAMPQGGTLELEIRPEDETVNIFIRDTGPGLSPEVLKHLFTPFFTTKKKGTGLGLSISRKIVEAHHGRLQGHNYERGAEFIVTLPRHRKDVEN